MPCSRWQPAPAFMQPACQSPRPESSPRKFACTASEPAELAIGTGKKLPTGRLDPADFAGAPASRTCLTGSAPGGLVSGIVHRRTASILLRGGRRPGGPAIVNRPSPHDPHRTVPPARPGGVTDEQVAPPARSKADLDPRPTVVRRLSRVTAARVALTSSRARSSPPPVAATAPGVPYTTGCAALWLTSPGRPARQSREARSILIELAFADGPTGSRGRAHPDGETGVASRSPPSVSRRHHRRAVGRVASLTARRAHRDCDEAPEPIGGPTPRHRRETPPASRRPWWRGRRGSTSAASPRNPWRHPDPSRPRSRSVASSP